MKRINKNIIVFILVFAFIILGARGKFVRGFLDTAAQLFDGIKSGEIAESVINFKESTDKLSADNLAYHDEMMDINSVKENLLNTKLIQKDDGTIVKAKSGSLISENSHTLTDAELNEVIDKLTGLKNISEESGAKFVYLAAPTKGCYEEAPSNVINKDKENFENFVTKLNENNIPNIDFTVALKEGGIANDNIFFYTDHHWKPYSGFVAAKAICNKLDITVNKDYLDINNYNIDTYKNFFLGSSGKKVGTYFTWHGADDIDFITPKFDTDITELLPLSNQSNRGTYDDVIMYMGNAIAKNYYGSIPYTAYCGGDYRLQIFKNNINPDGKKIIMIRDSYACVVSPFLALQTSELHNVDVRNFSQYEDLFNVYDYIKDVKPDYVMVLYTGINSVDKFDDRFNFNNQRN